MHYVSLEVECIFHVHAERTGSLLVVPLPEFYRPWIRGDKNGAPEKRAERCVEERRDERLQQQHGRI